MNNFNVDLEYSLDRSDDDILNGLYHRVFPHLKHIEVVTELSLQKKGIDKILHLKNGKSLLIDEKKRRKDYGDILLEEYTNYEKKKWGWMNRSKHTDYLVYVIIPSNKAYFIPFNLLQMAWVKNYYRWLADYGRKFAKNQYYTTSNIPIPKNVLLESIKNEIDIALIE